MKKDDILKVIEDYYFHLVRQSEGSTVPWLLPSMETVLYYSHQLWMANYLLQQVSNAENPDAEFISAIRDKFIAYSDIDDRWTDCVECADEIIDILLDNKEVYI